MQYVCQRSSSGRLLSLVIYKYSAKICFFLLLLSTFTDKYDCKLNQIFTWIMCLQTPKTHSKVVVCCKKTPITGIYGFLKKKGPLVMKTAQNKIYKKWREIQDNAGWAADCASKSLKVCKKILWNRLYTELQKLVLKMTLLITFLNHIFSFSIFKINNNDELDFFKMLKC